MNRDYDKSDMGPFADMDPALVSAITNYGTPPYRGWTRVVVRDVDSWEFGQMPTDIDGWMRWLEEARDDIPTEYRAEAHCVLNYERGHYDYGDSSDLRVWYDRRETDEEMIDRVNGGIAYVSRREMDELRQYEALKAKFEPLYLRLAESEDVRSEK